MPGWVEAIPATVAWVAYGILDFSASVDPCRAHRLQAVGQLAPDEVARIGRSQTSCVRDRQFTPGSPGEASVTGFAVARRMIYRREGEPMIYRREAEPSTGSGLYMPDAG
jgi:hypothetical protein